MTVRRGGREPDATVAHHNGRHTVQTRWREERIPQRLTVIVRVHIDEPRRDQQAIRVEHPLGATDIGSNRGDAAARYGDVSL